MKWTTACLLLMLGCVPAWADTPPAPPDGGKPPSGQPPGPPPEAFKACEGKKAGDKVTVSFKNTSVTATCEWFQGRLAARPDHMPPPPKP